MFVKIIELQTVLAKPPTKKCFLGPPNQLLLLHAIMQSRASTPWDSREDPHEVPEASAGKFESSSVIRNQFITDTWAQKLHLLTKEKLLVEIGALN